MPYIQIAGTQHSLRVGETTVGTSADAGIRVAGPESLGIQAVLSLGSDRTISIRRAGPTGVVRVNGVQLGAEPSPLIHGDKIEVLGHELLYGDEKKSGGTQMMSGMAVPEVFRESVGAPARPTAATGGRLVSLVDGREYAIPATGLTLGRDAACDVVVPGGDVSRRHADIGSGDRGYVLTDSSTNGVFVNGERIRGTQLLGRGDVVRIGGEEFRFYADVPAPSAPTPVVPTPAIPDTSAPQAAGPPAGAARSQPATGSPAPSSVSSSATPSSAASASQRVQPSGSGPAGARPAASSASPGQGPSASSSTPGQAPAASSSSAGQTPAASSSSAGQSPSASSAPPAAEPQASSAAGQGSAPAGQARSGSPPPDRPSAGPPSPPESGSPQPPPAPASPSPQAAAPPTPPAPRPSADPTPRAVPATAPAQPDARPVLATLEGSNEGVTRGRRFDLRLPLIHVGRGAHNDVVLPDDSVSDSHAKLQKRDGGWYVVDMGSTNGTYVAGRRIGTEQALPAECDLRFGGMKLRFRVVEAAADDAKGTRAIAGVSVAEARRASAAAREPQPEPATEGRRGLPIYVWVIALVLLGLAVYFFLQGQGR